ncbi:MAG: DUF1592 domain-containing protein [Acidobacteria bacterium]|nr:DUF1592 domain-containing protein [Acidobacteriota bacterium]
MRQMHPGGRIGGHVVVGALAVACLAGPTKPPARAAEGVGTSRIPSSAVEIEPSASTYRAVLDRYCVTCHNERLRTAHLTLDSVDIHDLAADAPVWEKVVRKLRTREMPPPPRARPAPETYDAFAAWLEHGLDRVAAARPNPGRPALHRLNRVEYVNAIRDLLAVEIDGRTLLPADDMAFGFDNIADALAFSPGLLERYLLAARRISRLAIGDPALRPGVETYRVPKALVQDDRMSEELPFGTRGGLALRHLFPLDGEYEIAIHLTSRPPRTSREQLDIRLDGERLALVALGDSGAGRPEVAETGDYGGADRPVAVRARVKAGSRLVGAAFTAITTAPEGLRPSYLPVGSISFRQTGVRSIDIAGPYDVEGVGDSPSRHRIFVCRPSVAEDERRCARQILRTLARRAYRRPIAEDDLRPLLSQYEAGRRAGDFDAGIRRALERILVDPEFLFRVERDPADVPPGTAYRLSDLELASRLSFFLWSSIPDDELVALAAGGRLSRPAVLGRQVRRMLADDRAASLVENFAAQWLHLRNVRAVTPDVREFPEFDDNLRRAFERETELFVASQLDHDRSVVELLTADYTFLNERLARHYDIPNVYGGHFRRVALAGEARKGLLGHGSILTVTSYATRTSPVVRGKWLLENILGAPPPPPPPDVPELEEVDEAGTPRSMRERLERHRANAVCASCHARMDPLGFALENFDAVGRWRNSDRGLPIDASGSLPNGTTFDGAADLRRLLEDRAEEFVATVTSRLLTYALGRGVEHYDMPSIRAIVREARPDGYRWSSIILGIVESTPFTMRIRRPEP